jgi:hypothetical protein
MMSGSKCLRWVNRVVFAVDQLLPVCHQLQTCRCTTLTDAMGHEREHSVCRHSLLSSENDQMKSDVALGQCSCRITSLALVEV